MKTNVLSQYSQPPYVLIGLEPKDHPILTDLNNKNSNEIKHIFNSKTDCENFITGHTNNEKIVIVVSSQLSNDERIQLQKYLQIDAMYSYNPNDNTNEEFICIYKREEGGKYTKIFLSALESLWFLLGLIFVIIFALLLPKLGASNGPLYTQYTVKMGCVFIIFLLNSLSLPLKHLLADMLNYRLHLCTQFYNLILVSFFVFGIALVLAKASVNEVLIIGMILMGCMPTGSSTNIIATKYCAGNEAGTLLNILFGNIIGVFLSPALIIMFMSISNIISIEESFDIKNYTRVLELLSLTVLLPTVIGQIITFIWTDQMMWAKTKLHFSKINVVALLLIIWVVICDLFQSNILKTVNTSDLIIIILFNALLFIMFLISAFFVARLPSPFICRQREIDHQPLLPEHQSKSPTLIQRWRFSYRDTVTFMFCGSTKNVTLGVPIITAMHPNASSGYVGLLTLPLVLYIIEQVLIGAIVIMILQRVLANRKNLLDQEISKE